MVMNRYIYIICMLLAHAYLGAEIGCMDNSYHLAQDNDTKTYHYVNCTCPCKRYKHYFYKGWHCSQCKHAHDPQLANMVRSRYTIDGLTDLTPLRGLRLLPRKRGS
jgi:hypothetical protein